MKNKYSHITLGERAVIQTQLQDGLSPAFIAASLGRHRSSISRELAPNGWKADRSQAGTFVERKTRYVALVKLSTGTAQATAEAFGAILQRFDVDLRRSLTPVFRFIFFTLIALGADKNGLTLPFFHKKSLMTSRGN